MAGKNKRIVTEMVDDGLQFVTHEGDIPVTPKDAILIKVKHAGICHSDVHMSEKGFFPDQKFPVVFGHETSGTVQEIGDDIAKAGPNFSVGDRVIVYPWGNCKDCDICRADQSNCFQQVLPDVDHSDAYIYGVRRDGGFQNYMLVHNASFVIKIPDGIPMDVAALVPCSGITAYNACQGLTESINNAMKIRGQALVAVLGAGGLALWAIQILKALYPESLTILAIDVVDDKLEDAKKQGADKTFKWPIKAEVSEVVQSYMASVGEFLDGAIDFTGRTDVQTRAFSILNSSGTLVFVGMGSGNLPSVSLLAMLFRANTLKAALTGSRWMCREMFDLILAGKVKPPPITAVTLDDVGNSVSLMRQNKLRGRHVVQI